MLSCFCMIVVAIILNLNSLQVLGTQGFIMFNSKIKYNATCSTPVIIKEVKTSDLPKLFIPKLELDEGRSIIDQVNEERNRFLKTLFSCSNSILETTKLMADVLKYKDYIPNAFHRCYGPMIEHLITS